MNENFRLRFRRARHELVHARCRVSWLSWAQRLAGIEAGFTPRTR